MAVREILNVGHPTSTMSTKANKFMTQILGKNIQGKCPKCANKGEVDLYESVNVTGNPELLEAVKNRKINSFHCEERGFKNEIMMPFLYHDMDNMALMNFLN